MPIDPSIALGFRPPPQQNPLELVQGIAALRSLQQSQQMNALKLKDEQQRQADDQAARKFFMQNPNATDDQLVTALGPKTAIPLITERRQAEVQKRLAAGAEIENQVKQGQLTANNAKEASSLFGSHKTAQDYAADFPTLQKLVPDPKGLVAPENWTPEWGATHAAKGQSYADQIETQIKQANAKREEILSPLQQKKAEADATTAADAAEVSTATKADNIAESAFKRRQAEANATKSEQEAQLGGPISPEVLAFAEKVGSLPEATPEQKKTASIAKATREQIQKDAIARSVAGRAVNQFVAPQNVGEKPAIEAAPEAIRGTVQAIINGDQPLPPLGRNNATNQAITYWVHKVDPTYTAARADLKKDLTSGSGSKNIQSLNTVVAHLGSIADNAEKLDNTTFRKYNNFGNWLTRETGTDKTAPFRVDRQAVSSELGTLLKGGVASVTEVQQWENQIDSADSPGTLHNTIKELAHVIKGRMGAIENRQAALPESSRVKILSDSSSKIMDRLDGGGGSAAPKEVTKAEYDALPVGATYLKGGRPFVKK